ncbi:MAG: hypothetical protein AB7V40_09900 [Methyloceanibacter sp.]
MSVRVKVSVLVAVSALAAAQALSARADDLIWTAKASDGLVGLNYGPLDPGKAPLFLLSCFDGMGIAVLHLRQGVEGAKPGDALTIALSSGAAKTEVEGEAARDDAADMTFAEASDIAVKPVLEVLRQAGPVTVTAGAASVSLSDNGRAEAVERFSQDCPLE